MAALGSEIICNDLSAALAGEVGRFEVTLHNGLRFVVTVGPGESLDHVLPLLDDPDACPLRIRKVFPPFIANAA